MNFLSDVPILDFILTFVFTFLFPFIWLDLYVKLTGRRRGGSSMGGLSLPNIELAILEYFQENFINDNLYDYKLTSTVVGDQKRLPNYCKKKLLLEPNVKRNLTIDS